MPTPPPTLDPRQLLPIAMAEAVTMASVVLRFALRPGEVVLSRPAHLGWLLGCMLLSSAAVVFFVVRSAALLRRQGAGEDLAEAKQQVLAFSVALMVPALALAWAGPRLVEAVFR